MAKTLHAVCESKVANNDRESALSALAAAFDGMQLEDGVSLHEADVIDVYGSDKERAAARALDTAIDWKDVPTDELERMHWVWSFFDAKGFRFHLPAMLAWWLSADRRPDADSTALDSAIRVLKQDQGPFRSLFEERLRLLSDPQIEATCNCLNWIASHDTYLQNDARRAIKALHKLQAWRLTQLR